VDSVECGLQEKSIELMRIEDKILRNFI